MPIVLGFAVVGGILFLISQLKGENDEESKELPTSKNLDETKFDLEEVRRLRKGLRQQMKAKKKSTPPSSAPPVKDGI